uniref:Uncharacterized protein n=1 Tax=Arundo donax TaxID=35708 RepID=A0A0A9GK13_ARUDO
MSSPGASKDRPSSLPAGSEILWQAPPCRLRLWDAFSPREEQPS